MTASVRTVVGTGEPGCSETEINDPFGIAMWANPDVLFFCEVGNQRIRWVDLTSGIVKDAAGSGERGYDGDGGRATDAAMSMPHELCFDPRGNIFVVERDSHAVRRIDRLKGSITTVAGTGEPGFAGDGGPGTEAQLRQPHSIAFDTNGDLLICDIGNHRVRRLNLTTGIIDTYAGTGDREPTPDGAPIQGTPLNGPRTIVVGPDGSLYLALREGNAIYRLDPAAGRIEHLAGTGQQGYSGDGGPAREATLAGPKGLAYGPGGTLYVADTENHAIRAIDLSTRIISTVLGTGERGDGPETDPLACKLARPHGLWATPEGALYVADSEAHRIRVLTR
jgi:DNA-binding beta-propeller fold protein YncE